MLELIERAPRRNLLQSNGEQIEFVVMDGGRPVARAVSGLDRRANRLLGRQEGYFGGLSLTDDLRVAQMLIDAIAGHQRAQGMQRMVGPIDLDGGGLMIGVKLDGFDVHEPHTPENEPFYDGLLRGCGMDVLREYAGFSLSIEGLRYDETLDRLQKRRGITVEPCDLRRGKPIYEALYLASGLDRRMALGAFAQQLDAVRRDITKGDLLLARVSGEPAGFLLSFTKGKYIRIASVHVREAFRRSGAALMLYGAAQRRAKQLHVQRVTASMIELNNRASIACAEAAGGTVCTRWREYTLRL
ncbi:GNAT family N-acetyltransferase [Eubacteriales bacterium OttesenSCG-928-N13]|nr:GNAT family N-acetyltransferase [Eubacteriales bacterium OttesenSCG-928-N13]